ncbi:MAG: hypothetical protein LIO96_07945 [Lachnospiraceae bacterium]|nr:hypothetical protein [Lachnospiraceae bacterium]
MLKNYIELTWESCYCSIPDFYEKVAKEAGYTVQPSTKYDCRKIRVTTEVICRLFDYADEVCHWSVDEIGAVFVNYGPKADLKAKADGPLYFAVIEDGFVYTWPEKEVTK